MWSHPRWCAPQVQASARLEQRAQTCDHWFPQCAVSTAPVLKLHANWASSARPGPLVLSGHNINTSKDWQNNSETQRYISSSPIIYKFDEGWNDQKTFFSLVFRGKIEPSWRARRWFLGFQLAIFSLASSAAPWLSLLVWQLVNHFDSNWNITTTIRWITAELGTRSPPDEPCWLVILWLVRRHQHQVKNTNTVLLFMNKCQQNLQNVSAD